MRSGLPEVPSQKNKSGSDGKLTLPPHFFFQKQKQKQKQQEEHHLHSSSAEHYHPTHHVVKSGGGGLVFTFSRSAPRLWSLNPCRMTHQVCDRLLSPTAAIASASSSTSPPMSSSSTLTSSSSSDHLVGGSGDRGGSGGGVFSSVGYATLEGHWLEGAEAMTVRKEKTGGNGVGGSGRDVVTFELISISRGCRGWRGSLLFPLVRQTQMRFFQDQADTMVRAAARAKTLSQK
jgi:hypothetical protein